ncbi:MAG TPA: hypothetical protein VGI12_19250 [Vicinamibacterales bacterium]
MARIVTLLALTMLAVRPGAPRTSLSLKDVMKRVEAYVAGYGEKASIVVCTEHYDQQAEGSGSSLGGRRRLVSDFALVYADAIRGWLGFRDVLEVDGHRVSDREDRLARVLMGAEGRFDEARRVSDESARYNLGAIQRNFNVPTAALFFFTPENHGRFKFAARAAGPDGIWEIAFKETDRPTLIATPDGNPVPTSGTIWVESGTGTVVRTRLQIETLDGRGQRARRGQGAIDVVYRHVDELDMWLPASMEERFDVTTGPIFDRVSGRAEYSDYRRFSTSGRVK